MEGSAVPRGSGHRVDPQAVLKRPVLRTQPSRQHLNAGKQMIFPGWITQSASAQENNGPERASRMPELQCSIRPRSPVNRPKDVVKRHVKLKEPTLLNLMEHEQMMFSAMFRSRNLQDLFFFKDQPLFGTSEHLTEDEYYKLKPICVLALAFQKLFRGFSLWRSNVFKRRLYSAKTFVQNHLLILEPPIRAALMEIRKISCQIIETGTYQVMTNHTYTLKEFHETQLIQQHEILSDIEPFRNLVKDVALSAGREYLLEHQTADNNYREDKNSVSKRVARFIRHVDYRMFNTVRSVVLNAVDVLLTVLKSQVGQMSSQNRTDPSEAVSEEEVEKKILSDIPLFMCELVLESNVLTYKPSEENFQETMRELIRQLKKTGKSMRSLTEDPEIDSLIQSEEVKDYLDSVPSLKSVLEEDDRLQRSIQKITDLFHSAFDSAEAYSHTFNKFLAFSENNEHLDFDAVGKQEPDLIFFAKTLELYHSRHKEALAVQERRHLGLLLVDQTQLKQKLVSSTYSSLEGSHGTLIQHARRQVDTLLAKVNEAKTKLEYSPSTTQEMAEQLIFLEEIEEGILGKQGQQDAAAKVYNLFKSYSVNIPPEDLVDFATLQPTISLLCDLIDDAVANRDSSMETFISSLATDRNKMQDEATKVARTLQNPNFLDINVNSSEVRPLFEKIQITINEMETLALSCNLYERKFELEKSKFDLLEETAAKFRLIVLLWNSVEEWDGLEITWQQSPLKQLDLKQLSLQISNYDQHVEQLEEGLPPNCSVVVLKDKLERVKQKLPVISNLRDLSMKPGLWVSLESLVGASLDVDEVTLATLEEHDVFSYEMEILEILS